MDSVRTLYRKRFEERFGVNPTEISMMLGFRFGTVFNLLLEISSGNMDSQGVLDRLREARELLDFEITGLEKYVKDMDARIDMISESYIAEHKNEIEQCKK